MNKARYRRAVALKNEPKINLKSNVRIEGNIENASCSPTLVDPKTVF